MCRIARPLAILLLSAGCLQMKMDAQSPITDRSVLNRGAGSLSRYHRLICLVHLVGPAKQGDAATPEYLPSAVAADRRGILAWRVQLTDDGKMAIIHIVAANRRAFEPILADKRPEIRVFEIGKDSREAIEAEMRKHVKGFDLSQFEVRAQ